MGTIHGFWISSQAARSERDLLSYVPRSWQADQSNPDWLFVCASVGTGAGRRIKNVATEKRFPETNLPVSQFAAWLQNGPLGIGLARSVARRAGIYAGRILKGATPANMPVELASKIDLVINFATAKALSLNISSNFLTIADEVIE
jgi:ABC transporter substrate binding protein